MTDYTEHDLDEALGFAANGPAYGGADEYHVVLAAEVVRLQRLVTTVKQEACVRCMRCGFGIERRYVAETVDALLAVAHDCIGVLMDEGQDNPAVALGIAVTAVESNMFAGHVPLNAVT